MIKINTAMFCNDLQNNDFGNKDCHQVICCTEFEGRYTTEDKRYQVHNGTVIYIPPNMKCSKLHGKGNVHYARIMFETDEFFKAKKSIVVADNSYSDLCKEIRQIVVWGQLDSDPMYLSLQEQMCRVVFMKIEMLNNMTAYSQEVDDYKSDIIENISNSDFMVNDFMLGANITRSNVSKKFKIATNETAKQFYNRKKMEYAEQLILNNIEKRVKLEELATMCGYEEQYYFLRLFKKHTGMSPEEYRIKHGGQ